ncbi:TIGR04500 family putative peptide maturation system protein [Nonomuraea bangladeshensis]|uniref:TIGR04500 family putative peptide maturation system protein n=1 Tax=Nonomuraea bangladeshensis TaxID=404385 RepID=UPI003C2CF257
MSTEQITPSSETRAAFATELAEAVALLRQLPKNLPDEARRRVRTWSEERPWLSAELVVDQPPGSTRAGYDLLLEHPAGGTVALSTEVDDGIPWLVDHSTHWAAGQVLRVDGHDLSIAAALSTIRAFGARDRQIHERLVDHCILLGEMRSGEGPLTDAETQRAADEFRRRRGLDTRERTLTWLAEAGLSEEAFWHHVRAQAYVARVRDRFAGEPARRHLAEHPEEFTLRRAAWVTGVRPEVVGELADGPVDGFLDRAAAAVRSARVRLEACTALTPRLPRPIRELPAGQAVGPVPVEGGYLAGVVYEVVAPSPGDPEVLDAARDAAYQAWLDERRRSADIRWFWL